MDYLEIIEKIKSIPDQLADEICDYIDQVYNQYNQESPDEDLQEEQ